MAAPIHHDLIEPQRYWLAQAETSIRSAWVWIGVPGGVRR